MSLSFEELVKLVEEVSTNYQKSDRIKKHASKRLSTKGEENKVGAPYSKSPPTARAKSAPPGFGFTMEELYKLIDEALLEQEPGVEEPEEDLPSDEECRGVKPTKPAMRFEWVLIEAARKEAGAEPGQGDPAYKCARTSGWRNMMSGQGPLGELADKTIELCKASGFFSNEDFAGATMEDVGKKSPAWGGPAIQPKTDIRFGSKNISVKLVGDIQAASAEAGNTAPQLQFIMDEWLKENVVDSVQQATIAAAQEQTRILLEGAKEQMMEHADKHLITHKRAVNMIKDIAKERAKGKGADLKKIEKYEGALAALREQGVVNELGEIVMEEFDFKNWQVTFGNEIREKLQDVFLNVSEALQGEDAPTPLRDVLVDEILSGRRIFKDAPEAVAHYMISPDHVFSLVPSDGAGYKKTIETFGRVVKIDVRSKGGRKISDDGRLATIGARPSYRFDIKGKDIAEAFHAVEAEFEEAKEQQATAALSATPAGDDVATGGDQPMSEAEADSSPAMDEFRQDVDDIMQSLGKTLTKKFAQSLDVEETAASMTGGED